MSTYNSKILLFGEYSLLYKSMALTMPYSKYTGSWNFISNNSDEFAKQSHTAIQSFAQFVSNHQSPKFSYDVASFKRDLENGLYFKSSIPQGFGLGSSGSLVAAFFCTYLNDKSYLEQLNQSASHTMIQELRAELSTLESFFHGTSSGIDPLSIVLNKPLLVKSLDEISCIELPEVGAKKENFIFLLDTGFERNTDGLVARFKQLAEEITFKLGIDQELVPTVNLCVESFLKGDTILFYENLNQLIDFQLENMAFLIPDDLQKVVQQGVDSGDYLLKICGAGGGGYMLGFTKDWTKTQETIKDYNLGLIYNY